MADASDVLCYALQHASRFQNERGKGDSAQVGARSELGDDVGQHIALIGFDNLGVIVASIAFAIVCRSSAAWMQDTLRQLSPRRPSRQEEPRRQGARAR